MLTIEEIKDSFETAERYHYDEVLHNKDTNFRWIMFTEAFTDGEEVLFPKKEMKKYIWDYLGDDEKFSLESPEWDNLPESVKLFIGSQQPQKKTRRINKQRKPNKTDKSDKPVKEQKD